jgi:hypothetical protein
MSHQSFVKSSGAIPDGYVLTYSVADGYWKPKLASAISGIQKQVEWSLVDRAINNSLSLTNLAGSFTTGIRFQVQNTLTITGVRFRYNATANKTIKVSLWDNTQARIASGTVAVTTGTSVYSGYFDVPYTVTSSTQNKTLAVSIWQNDGGSYNAGAADSNQASTPFKAGPFLWYPFAFSNYGTGDAFIASTAGGEVYNYIEPIFGEVLLTTPNATGDLSGVYPNPTVAKIKGNAVATQTLGASQDGYQLTWSNTDGYWLAKPTISVFPTTTPPLASTWTVVNSRDSVAISNDTVNGINVSRAGAVNEDQLTGYYQSIAGGNWTVRAGMAIGISLAAGSKVNGASLFVSDDTKFVEIGVATSSGARFFNVNRWTTASTYGSANSITTPDTEWIIRIQNGEPTYWHINYDGTNINFYISRTGRINQGFLVYSEAVGAYLGTITRCGVVMRGNNNGAGAVPTKVWLFDWLNQ